MIFKSSFSSLQGKMTAMFIIMAILPASIIGFVANNKANSLLYSSSESAQEHEATRVADRLDQYLQDEEASITTLAKNPFVLKMGSDEQTAVMKSFYEGNGMFELVFCVNPQGIIQNTWPHTDFGGKKDFTDRQWFKDVTISHKTIMSDTYVSAFTKQATAPIIAPITDDKGQLIGYMGGNIKLDNVSALAKELNTGSTGRGIILDKKFFYLTDSRDEEKGKTHELFKNEEVIPIMESGIGKVITVASNLVAYAPIGKTGWSVLKEQNRAEVMTNSTDLRELIIIVILGSVLGIGLIGFYYVRSISRPIAAIAKVAGQIADGHLVKPDISYHGEDELKHLIASFCIMTDNLQTLLKHTKNSALLVTKSTEQWLVSIGHSAQASNQIAISISEVAEGSEKQINAVQKTVNIIESMSKELTGVAESATAVAAMSQQTALAANNGHAEINLVVKQMDNIETTVASLAQVVVKLGRQSQEVGQIIGTISGLAGQTNLLALNAAIEAARAGEEGRGFSVVAEEVRKLAEQSNDAAKKIATLIGDIQADTEKAVEAMNEGTKQVKVGSDVVNSAGLVFDEIVQLIETASKENCYISDLIFQIAAEGKQIAASVGEIEVISNVNAQYTQSVSAATEEQTAAMQEISASSQGMGSMLENLNNAINKFTFKT